MEAWTMSSSLISATALFFLFRLKNKEALGKGKECQRVGVL